MVDIYERTRRATGDIAETGLDLGIRGVGVGAGLFTGKFIGDFTEQLVTEPVDESSSKLDMFIAWLSNNIPKGVAAYALTRMETGDDTVNKILDGAVYGLAGSVIVDTYTRATHKGVPTLVLGKSDSAKVQTLLQENAQLKQMVQNLQSRGSSVRIEQVNSTPVQVQPSRPLEKKYEFAEGSGIPGVVAEKRPLERKYEFTGKNITSPEVLTEGFGFLGC